MMLNEIEKDIDSNIDNKDTTIEEISSDIKKSHEIIVNEIKINRGIISSLVGAISLLFNRPVDSSLEQLFKDIEYLKFYFTILEKQNIIVKYDKKYIWKSDEVAFALFVSTIHGWAETNIPWKKYKVIFDGINFNSARTLASQKKFTGEKCQVIVKILNIPCDC